MARVRPLHLHGHRGPPTLPTRRPPVTPRRHPGGPPPLPSERPNAPVWEDAPFRSDRERYGGDEGAPLGQWVDVVSTWVNRARFDPDNAFDADGTGDWTVEFLDLSMVVYHDTPGNVWAEFFNSSSKGLFIHYRCTLEGRAYETLRGPQRKAGRGLTEIQEPRKYGRHR